jgi:hypothetical protein
MRRKAGKRPREFLTPGADDPGDAQNLAGVQFEIDVAVLVGEAEPGRFHDDRVPEWSL